MSPSMKKAKPYSLALLLSLLVSACSLGSDPGPEQVAEGFLEAIRTGDNAKFATVLTPRALATVQSGEGLSLDGGSVERFEVLEALVDGTNAEVPVQLHARGQDQDVRILTRRTESGWRVHGVAVPMGTGNFRMDFEQTENPLGGVAEELGRQLGEELASQMQEAFQDAQDTWEQGGTDEEIAETRARFEGIASTTVEAHERLWRVDVDATGRTPLEILGALAGAQGLEIDPGDHAGLFGEAIDFSVRGVSRVEAVERLCEQIGVYPVWPAPEPEGAWGGEQAAPAPLTFAAGERLRPVSFVGPFLIEVSELTENTPNPTGEIRLSARALGLPEGIAHAQGDSSGMLHVTRLRGAKGQVLTDESIMHMAQPEVRGGYFSYSMAKELTNLLRDVTRIDTLEGEMRLRVPVYVESWTFEREGSKLAELEAGQLLVTEWDASSKLKLEGKAVDQLEVFLSPRRADGSPIGVRFQFSNGWNEELEAGIDCPDAPDFLDVKVCRFEEISYPFSMPPIPFLEYARRPKQLEVLQFDGLAPLSFEVLEELKHEEGMAQLKLRIQNGSNKDVTSAFVSFRYFDGEGTLLNDFPHTLNGSWDFDLQGTAPLVLRWGGVDLDTQAAFAPEATATIEFELLRAEFTDGTRWEP